MAQFRGTLEGQRGAASRLGSKKSGLNVTANGWNIGANVRLRHLKEDGRERDIMHVSVTGGSHGGEIFTLSFNQDMLFDGGYNAIARVLEDKARELRGLHIPATIIK